MFHTIIGQEETKQRLGHALTSNPGHAYIMTGPRGVGRKTIARAFAAGLLCENPDMNGACGQCPSCRYFQNSSHPDYREILLTGKEKVIPVETVRQQISGDLHLQPHLGRRKVFLITADDLNEQGQNALLKSLEEPPEPVVFLLTALSADHLLPTIVSRAVVWPVRRSKSEDLEQILHMKGFDEGPETAFYIAFSGGIPGIAVEMAASDWFADLRQETIQFFLGIPTISRADLLTDGYAFLDNNRQRMPDLLDILESLIRDLLVLPVSRSTDRLINADQAVVLKRFLQFWQDEKTARTHLTRSHEALMAARRGLSVNASFEGLACQLMLALRKELKHA